MEGRGQGTPKGGRIEHLLTEMRNDFPVFEQCLPLASGIEEELTPHFPRDPGWRVIAALRRHVHESDYLRGLLRNNERYGLHGEVRSHVSEGERHHAQRLLERMGESVEIPTEVSATGGMAKEDGLRLLITLQSAHKFGHDMVESVEPYLVRLEGEDALTEVGVQLLDVDSREEWLRVLACEAGTGLY